MKTVGPLPQGLPHPTFPWTGAADVIPLLIAAAGITLVSLTDTIATSTSFAARRGDEVDPNQEMIGLGTANMAAGMFQGFAVSSSGSRTAVAEQAGAKTQLTGLVGAAWVALLLLFFSSLLTDLPQTALAAVVIAAAISLADIPALVRFDARPHEIAGPVVAATAGVVFFGVLAGIVIAIVLSILLFFRRSWWPTARSSAAWARPGSGTAYGPNPRPRARRRPRLPLGGAAVLRQRGHLPPAGSPPRPRPAPPVGRAPMRGDHRHRRHRRGHARAARHRAERAGQPLAFVELRSRLQDLVHRYGLFETLDRDHFYHSIDEALVAIGSEEAGESTSSPE